MTVPALLVADVATNAYIVGRGDCSLDTTSASLCQVRDRVAASALNVSCAAGQDVIARAAPDRCRRRTAVRHIKACTASRGPSASRRASDHLIAVTTNNRA
jgi:hypothetical protein